MATAIGYSGDALPLKSKYKKMRDYEKWNRARPDGKREESGANWGK